MLTKAQANEKVEIARTYLSKHLDGADFYIVGQLTHDEGNLVYKISNIENGTRFSRILREMLKKGDYLTYEIFPVVIEHLLERAYKLWNDRLISRKEIIDAVIAHKRITLVDIRNFIHMPNKYKSIERTSKSMIVMLSDLMIEESIVPDAKEKRKKATVK